MLMPENRDQGQRPRCCRRQSRRIVHVDVTHRRHQPEMDTPPEGGVSISSFTMTQALAVVTRAADIREQVHSLSNQARPHIVEVTMFRTLLPAVE